MSFYPVSLEHVRHRAARKTGGALQLPLQEKSIEYSAGTISPSQIKKQTNPFGETITRIDGEIPSGIEFKKDERVIFVSYDQTKYTHALHDRVSKPSPELARGLLKRYSKAGDIILVPFSGEGVMNLEALLIKRHSVGIDNDPLSRFISRVKITPLDENEVSRSSDKLMRNIANYIPELVAPEDIPVFPFRDKLYEREILLELAYIRNEINHLRVSSELTDFYKICFSSILRAVSNYEVNSKGKWVRKPSKKIYPTLALTKFAEALLINSLRVMNFSNVCPNKIITEFPEDSTPNQIKYPDGYFNMAVASLPEAESTDFSGLYPPEIYWLGLAPASSFKNYSVNENTGGQEHGQYRIKAKKSGLKLGKIFGIDITTAYITYKYLEDMRASMEEVFRVLEPGGKYIVITGNFNIRGQLFESYKHITSLAKQAGFKIHETFISENIKEFMRMPAEKRINSDRIIVLEK